jgi:hypothetical protein
MKLAMLCVLLGGQAFASEAAQGRFYPGDPRPVGEVAVLVGDVGAFAWGCPFFQTLTEAGERPKRLFGGKTLAEVLPGHYTVEIGCEGARPGKPAELEIDAKAGHVYYVLMDQRSLLVLDIAGDGDYGKGRRANFVKQSVEKYFRGKRQEVKLHGSKLPVWF